jgi:hypothetical protein
MAKVMFECLPQTHSVLGRLRFVIVTLDHGSCCRRYLLAPFAFQFRFLCALFIAKTASSLRLTHLARLTLPERPSFTLVHPPLKVYTQTKTTAFLIHALSSCTVKAFTVAFNYSHTISCLFFVFCFRSTLRLTLRHSLLCSCRLLLLFPLNCKLPNFKPCTKYEFRSPSQVALHLCSSLRIESGRKSGPRSSAPFFT